MSGFRFHVRVDSFFRFYYQFEYIMAHSKKKRLFSFKFKCASVIRSLWRGEQRHYCKHKQV